MAFRISFVAASALFWSMALAYSQTPQPSRNTAPIVQPGAPGQSSKVISSAAARTKPRPPTEADISFMQGMIMHHSQAVEMTKLLRERGQSKEVQALGERITISQTDEIKYMKQWLDERGLPIEMDSMVGMKDMDHSKMDMGAGATMTMPGMLTPQQMEALSKARGAVFDHLFLTGMIQHHTGALTMVKDLFDTPAAGQDYVLFDFATDVDNTQRAEIRIMQGLLQKEKQ